MSRPGDGIEQEADRIAERFMATDPPYARGDAQTAGAPLEPSTQSIMEKHFGHDFGKVRIHADARSAEAVRSVDARAYTVGDDITFGSGQYRPESKASTRLLVHELAHVVQQRRSGRGLMRNSLAPVGGSAPYLPTEKTLSDTVAVSSPADRKTLIEEFAAEVLPIWQSVKRTGHWEQLKTLRTVAADPATTNAIDPVPPDNLIDEFDTVVKTRYSDLGFRLSLGFEADIGEAILDEQVGRQSYELDDPYADIDDDSFIINQYAKDGDLTTRAIMSLRNIQTVVNRFEAARLAAGDPNVDYSLAETLALYRQEGSKEMPASARSLQSGIPTGVSDSGSLVGHPNVGRIEIRSGVLILNPECVDLDGKIIKSLPPEELRFRALKLYVNHIAGLDIIHQHPDIASLAEWSVETLTELNKTEKTRMSQAYARVAATAKWTGLRDDLQVMKSPKAYIISPANPVNFVKDILVETMMFLRRYSDIGRVLGDADPAAAGLPQDMPLSLTYMQFNSSDIYEAERPKQLVQSAIKAARRYKGTGRFDDLRKEAALISKVNDFEEIRRWLLGRSPYESKDSSRRWQLVIDFIEHAGSQDWASWNKMRGNASLVRTQTEFYQVAFGD